MSAAPGAGTDADDSAVGLPVARVIVDTPLAHLDRLFDYSVPTALDAAAEPGVRVRVRFSGRLTDAYIIERSAETQHSGKLSAIERVVSTLPVLTSEIAELARAVADRNAGVISDVLRLAIPPRHAAVEKAASKDGQAVIVTGLPTLDGYVNGPRLLERLGSDDEPPVRVSWSMLPGDWPAELAAAVAATTGSGRGSVVVVPDARDVARVGAALAAAVGAAAVVELSAGLGPQERYRRFLRVLRGAAPVVVGTRAAVWAPVTNLGLIAVWDDGDDLLAEPRAPYAHARDVAVLRSHLSGVSLVLAGHAVSVEAQQLVESGWAEPIDPLPRQRKASWPTVRAAGDDDQLGGDAAARAGRLPSIAWQAAKAALAAGDPVLVQVPRRGYLPRLGCDNCREPARCVTCHGPLATDRQGRTACSWCGRSAAGWKCSNCGSTELRAAVIGAGRTADELGRAFPGTPIKTSAGDAVVSTVEAGPAIVVATPGAEPVASGGYGAALLLDGWALLSRADLRATEETLRRWMAATSLVKSGVAGGRVVVMAAGELPVVQALIGARPRPLAERELLERRQLHLPPAARLAALTGTPAAIQDLMASLELPAAAEILGPVDVAVKGSVGPTEQLLIRVPLTQGRALAATLKSAAAVRSARKAPDSVRIMLDPQQIG